MIDSGAVCCAYETVERADRSLPLLIPMSEVAGRMSTQEGRYFLEKPRGGKGKLLGGVPGVKPAKVFVIGGAEIYRQALPLAQRLYLTEVAQDFAADVFFPEFGAREWREISRSAMKNGAGLDFTFAVYQRA